MGIKKSKFLLRIVGVILEFVGIVGAIVVPTVFTIILPISKALEYYNNNGEGLGMILKTVLVVVCLSPLLAAIIFLVLFIPGAALFDMMSEDADDPNKIVGIYPNGEPNTMDDFFLVKEDNPSRSDAGIAEMNWRMKHQNEDKNNG